MAWTTGGTLIEEISYAIMYEDYEKAEELLNDFKDKLDKKYFFLKEERQKQYQDLLAQFKTQKTHSQFFATIEKYDVNNARDTLNILITEKLISKNEREALEERINDITEEGLFSQIQSAKKNEKENLMEIYARVYPEGKNSRKITTDLIAGAFSRVINAITNHVKFEDLYEQVHKITLYLEKYIENGVNLVNIVPVTEFSERVKNYVSELKSKGPSEDQDIKIFKLVRYTGESSDGEIEDLEGRKCPVAVGVEGAVTECCWDSYDEDNIFTVKFSEEKEENQTELNQLENKTAEIMIFEEKKKKGKKKLERILAQEKSKKGTAQFYSDELEVREPITEIDRNLIRNEIIIIEEVFIRHYSGNSQQKYKSQDFPNGINALVSK